DRVPRRLLRRARPLRHARLPARPEQVEGLSVEPAEHASGGWRSYLVPPAVGLLAGAPLLAFPADFGPMALAMLVALLAVLALPVAAVVQQVRLARRRASRRLRAAALGAWMGGVVCAPPMPSAVVGAARRGATRLVGALGVDLERRAGQTGAYPTTAARAAEPGWSLANHDVAVRTLWPVRFRIRYTAGPGR